ncbi:MAG: T9SS type A sorting domain-containing protein [Clostridia bacterium]|nr:T9SS type A sorting domain-containing protein [Clostridia bacterium]
MKRIYVLPLLLLMLPLFMVQQQLLAQNKAKPVTLKHYMSAEEAKLKHLIGKDAQVTDPPPAPVTNIAEFDKMQSVLIRYSFGIPYNLIAAMSEKCMVTTLVSNASEQTYVTNQYTQQGVNLANCEFILAPSNSYWTRDYGPWFVFDGNDAFGIVDFTYNRPRPADNAIPAKVAQTMGINLFEMDIETAGGNYMTNGMGISASSDLIWEENPQHSHQQIDNIFHDYLGIETYHVLDDPNNTYIDHIDCWGKFLDINKVLIRSVPTSHPQYDELEATADYFAQQTSSYGTPFEVYRVYTPNNQPYSNSLILNKRVYVPTMNSPWDDEALASYQEAMPGYEVLGFTGSWESTDALHCRTKGLADINQVHIRHIPLSGNVQYQNSFPLEATIKAFSASELNPDSVLIFYRANEGAWQTAPMTNTGGQQWSGAIPATTSGSRIDYYLFAADQAGNRITHPFIGAPDPHFFFVDEQAFAQISVTPESLSVILPPGGTSQEPLTICNFGEIDLTYTITTNTAIFEEIAVDVADSPGATSYDYNTWDESNWIAFEVEGTEMLESVEVSYTWSTDSYPEEGSLHLMSPEGTVAVVASAQPNGNYVQIMSDFINEQGDGTWHMWIEDTYGDGGHQATNIEITFTSNVNTFGWLSATMQGVIPPGECVDINVLFNAGDLLPGVYEGAVNIASNDPNQPLVEIPATLEVLAPGYVVCQPDTLWILDYDQFMNGVTAHIANPSGAPVTIEEITESGYLEWIISDLSEELPFTLQPDEELTFTVTSLYGFTEANMVYDYLNIITSEGVVIQNIALDWDLIESISKPTASSVSCYPNPFATRLTIDFNSSAISGMRILDINGKIVKAFTGAELSQNKIVWDARTSAGVSTSGVYFVEIISGGKKEIFKVLKTE